MVYIPVCSTLKPASTALMTTWRYAREMSLVHCTVVGAVWQHRQAWHHAQDCGSSSAQIHGPQARASGQPGLQVTVHSGLSITLHHCVVPGFSFSQVSPTYSSYSMCVHVRACTHVCEGVRACLCAWVCVHARARTHVCVLTHVCVRVCMCACMHVILVRLASPSLCKLSLACDSYSTLSVNIHTAFLKLWWLKNSRKGRMKIA